MITAIWKEIGFDRAWLNKTEMRVSLRWIMEISEIKIENRIRIIYSNIIYNNWDDSRGTTVGDTYEKINDC